MKALLCCSRRADLSDAQRNFSLSSEENFPSSLDPGLPFSGDVRESIKALAEVYASRPFSHIEVSAKALERIWQQCCKDERDFAQFYTDMWSEIDNGNEEHRQRCFGPPMWIDLQDK
ncbi:unnamed protein product [Vitrella brassicaformis CCMP3155]|uniref:Uncharacterized protein n=1 Tax=Vitrella brassicaformis (strain CCMP3155) TaxID=1169540 RepID=A0A0G4H5C7_VITBC|nr:unnamed protein product [Vitrella brassicaformis CCMP3155]|eukprot:CEM38917.1 unnamed protein product [Vitrella brassicaformis CCMP3155]